MTETILEVEGVSKYFGAVRALHNVSLSVAEGEVIGLVGDNGAGKSTLVNVLSGVIKPDHGRLAIRGEEVTFVTPGEARERGIETVFQNLSLIPTLDVGANIFLGREIYGPGRIMKIAHRMNRSKMRAEITAGLSQLGVTVPPLRTKVSALSGGQRQMVAIARAVLSQKSVLLLDEPAAALGVSQTERVLSFIEQLKQHSIGIILISHNMEHVLRVCDRIIVMRLGERVFEKATSATTINDVVMHITGAAKSAKDEMTGPGVRR